MASHPSTRSTFMSVEEYLALPEEKPYLEYIDGEVIPKPMGNFDHGMIVLDERDGMPQTCAINLDNILTVAQSDLVEHITTLGPLQMQLVDHALKFALAIGS